ncbi:SRPBCC family protein [Mesorhizobium sp. ORM16]|uniref:SRPBCC family protein n=1 Tax=Mesorhizobium sp. ORM16 TaxID=3376989 RepID=UPI0038574F4A
MPQIKQVFTVNHPRPVVWARFQDLPQVAECLPGASLTDPVTATHAAGRMTVKLGPVRADFGGAVEIEADEASYTGKIAGTGMDKSHGSRAKGNVVYTLEETANATATKVTVMVDYTLAGSLAQFARGGIVDAVADQICREFATNLETQLNAEREQAAEPTPDGCAANPAGAVVKPAPHRAKELNAIGLIVAILRRKVRVLLGRA